MYESKRTQSDQVHFQMIEQYVDLFRKIENDTLSPSSVQLVRDELHRKGGLSPYEIQVHDFLLTEMKKMSDQVKKLHTMSKHLKVLHEMGQTFANTFDRDQIFAKAYQLLSSVLDADTFIIALYKEGDEFFEVPFSRDNDTQYDPQIIPLGKGLISKVLRSGKPLRINTFEEVKQHQSVVQWGNPLKQIETCLFVPMILNNKIKGVISAQNYKPYAYNQEHEEILRIIGIQVASAIETAYLYDKVLEMSIKDDLTLLKNSRKFHSDLEELISKADETKPVVLMMIDSDNLKKVNDEYGHHVGDKLIKHIANSLLVHLFKGEDVYRYAGDEFMLLTSLFDLEDMEKRAYKIRNYLMDHPLIHEDIEIPTTISIGIAACPKHTRNAGELKRMADEAMYGSKKNGKNTITVYQPY